MGALPPISRIASFLFIIPFSLASKLKQGSFFFFFSSAQAQTRVLFLFSSAQAQGLEVDYSLCVELNKVKLEVILKVEAHKTFVLY
jgi:hypothetical protein